MGTEERVGNRLGKWIAFFRQPPPSRSGCYGVDGCRVCDVRLVWAVCRGEIRLRQACQAGVPILNSMSLKKHLLYAGAGLLAVSSSISVCTVTDVASELRKHWLSGSKATANAPVAYAPGVAADGSADAPPLAIGPNARADAMPLPSLAEVLRMDVTVDWVLQRWPRVTTGLPQLQLQGYRVPLVSGTRVSDVAGSLTYYFNARQQVQRITLRGTTGDPSVLASILKSRYGFARRLTNNPGVVLFEAVDSNNRPVGSLKIRSAAVVSVNQPYSRFQVDLVIDRTE